MNLTVSGADTSVEVSELAFGKEFNEALVHQVVTAYLAKARQGSRAQKTRSEVSGGGRKPWRQKGTGRARAGTIRSPIWRGGGVTFASKPQDFSQKVNKKMYRAAIRCIFSELLRQERLTLVESFSLDSHKTKGFVSKLKELNLNEVLVITEEVDSNLYLASRNLPNVGVREASDLDPVSLVGYEKVLVTVPALKKIEEMLA